MQLGIVCNYQELEEKILMQKVTDKDLKKEGIFQMQEKE